MAAFCSMAAGSQAADVDCWGLCCLCCRKARAFGAPKGAALKWLGSHVLEGATEGTFLGNFLWVLGSGSACSAQCTWIAVSEVSLQRLHFGMHYGPLPRALPVLCSKLVHVWCSQSKQRNGSSQCGRALCETPVGCEQQMQSLDL